MSLHKDLIAQAHHLCNKEPKKPRQASLRRAISTAYYALFHCLVAGATKTLLPKRYRKLRPLLGRVFTHQEMAKACERLLSHAKQPRAMVEIMGAELCSAHLVAVAEAFGDLQQARNDADHNTARRFCRREARDLVVRAENAMIAFEAAQGEPHAALLQIAFIDPRQIRTA